jgi:gliding motility-associated-like protein
LIVYFKSNFIDNEKINNMHRKKSPKPLYFVYVQSLICLLLFGFSKSLFSQNTALDQILASDGAALDWFGRDISISEDYLVVGAPGAMSAGNNSAGAIYIYSKDSNCNWVNEQKLITPDNSGNDWFGYSVSISGNTLVVGAPYKDEFVENSGAAYIFELDGNDQWNFKQKLTADDATYFFLFGFSVYNTSDYIAIQAAGNGVSDNNGTVYLFEKNQNGDWAHTQKIAPNTITKSYSFGKSISISGDYLVLGNPSHSDINNNQGAVHIYQKNGVGIWDNETIIIASDGATEDYFSESVSLYENTLVVGAPYTDDFGENTGSVYLYKSDGNNNWNMEQKILASDEQESAAFGYSVQIHENKFIAGALNHNGLSTNAGAAYTYILTENAEWSAAEIYYAFDASTNDSFGHQVGINSKTIAISTQNHDANGENAGAVYISEVNCVFSLECPEKIIIETNASTCEGLLNIDETIFFPENFNRRGNISLSQISGPTPGEILEIGNYEVSFEAITDGDIFDNCTFLIEVADKEAPTALCQDLAFLLNPCEEISILAEDIDFGSSDACGIASYNLSQNVFDENSIGSNSVELTVTDIHGNSASCNASISIESAIQIDASTLISPESITTTYGESVELNPNTANLDELIFSWYVDGTLYCTDCYSISIYPASNALIELLVEHIDGCFAFSDAVSIQLLVDYSIHIPTAFSPNEDGVNDHFKAYFSDGVERAYELQVQDRWGRIVFHQKGDNIFWDGNFRGQKAITGVYNYTMVLKLINETEIVKTGDVCLVR